MGRVASMKRLRTFGQTQFVSHLNGRNEKYTDERMDYRQVHPVIETRPSTQTEWLRELLHRPLTSQETNEDYHNNQEQ